jgi:hypothetical protein
MPLLIQLAGQKEVGIYLVIQNLAYLESEVSQKLYIPGPGAYLNEIKEKIILHDGAYKTPGGK